MLKQRLGRDISHRRSDDAGTAETGNGGRVVSSPAPLNDLAGTKVMVIDDSQTIRRTAETLLAREGYAVITASDGYEALGKIVDHQPSLIFIDIMMPRLDGYQVCSLIKGNPKFSGTPVVMLSSKDGVFDRARGRIVGSDKYLTKPFTKDEILSAVKTYLTKK
jgi:twitching motility two-component system response regulator PilG